MWLVDAWATKQYFWHVAGVYNRYRNSGQSGGFTNGVLLAGQRPGPRLKVS